MHEPNPTSNPLCERAVAPLADAIAPSDGQGCIASALAGSARDAAQAGDHDLANFLHDLVRELLSRADALRVEQRRAHYLALSQVERAIYDYSLVPVGGDL